MSFVKYAFCCTKNKFPDGTSVGSSFKEVHNSGKEAPSKPFGLSWVSFSAVVEELYI